MGITNFRKFFKELIDRQSSKHSLQDYKNLTLPIDAYARLYRLCIGMQGMGKDMLKSDGTSICHLWAIFMYTAGLIEVGIDPLYVFDGRKIPIEKIHTIEERKKTREKIKVNCEAIKDKTSMEYHKKVSRTFHLTSKKVQECKTLLDLMGVRYIDSVGEADKQCALLSQQLDSGVLTDDTDILAFGGTKILTGGSLRTKEIVEIDRKEVLKFLLEKANKILGENSFSKIEIFTQENFVDFSILMGTDYTDKNGASCKVFGMDNDQLFTTFVLSGFSVEKVKEKLETNNIRISKNFLDTWSTIRKIYLSTEQIAKLRKKCGMHRQEIIKFLCVDNNINQNLVASRINKILYRQTGQTGNARYIPPHGNRILL